MKIGQLPHCLLGRHHRDAARARVHEDRVTSRCVGCGVRMERRSGQWRAVGHSRLWLYVGLIGLLLVALGVVLFQQMRPQNDMVVFVGDSITEGVASSDPMTKARPGLYQAHAGNAVIVANEGVNGITLGSLAGQVAGIENYHQSGRRNVVVIDGGSNDLALSDAKAAPLFRTLRIYALRLRDGGWTVGVGTIMTRGGLTAAQEHERQAFNRMIRNGPLKADGIAVIDFDAGQRAGQVPLADGVHPTDVGYAGMSKMETPFIDAALAAKP